MRTQCSTCGRLVFVIDGWLVNHKEPESSAMCYGSGTTVSGPQYLSALPGPNEPKHSFMSPVFKD